MKRYLNVIPSKSNRLFLNNNVLSNVVSPELRKEEKNYDLIKIRFRKVRLKRKMIGINERSAPQILCA